MMARKQVSGRRHLGVCVLITTAILALPSVLHADPAEVMPNIPGPGMPDAAGKRAAIREKILDARIEELRAGLQLSAAQAPLWQPVADAIRGFDKARGRGFRQRLENAADSIDGLRMQGEHMARVGVAMSQLADATRPLVATLTADQKSRLPALVQRVGPRKVMARAFEVPMETPGGPEPRSLDGPGLGGPGLGGGPGTAGQGAAGQGMAGQGTKGPTGPGATAPGPANATGTAAPSPRKDSDDEDD